MTAKLRLPKTRYTVTHANNRYISAQAKRSIRSTFVLIDQIRNRLSQNQVTPILLCPPSLLCRSVHGQTLQPFALQQPFLKPLTLTLDRGNVTQRKAGIAELLHFDFTQRDPRQRQQTSGSCGTSRRGSGRPAIAAPVEAAEEALFYLSTHTHAYNGGATG